ncbi:hypothetical protein I6G82_11375 [Lysinibacillus macroides]|uniref:Uncharacterized protein n=1 Tax=Lysinibacillus macroides TaxID=33935 RepID=A0A0M9DLT3_9BACI|nr:hypothetical protein [Lysinibacillus macroides]KOY83026.1 hypothetical protein ADM90_06880 [Lysinibacillus macroides]QPR70121.1 hypothetical protein I6G82_11375 [Lysinibacillus macroides]
MKYTTNKAFGKPFLYKGLNIYPVKMKDTDEFYDAVQCLLLPKNDFQQPEIIRMSYLLFLLTVSQSNDEHRVLEKLLALYRLVFKTEDIQISINEKGMAFVIVNGITLHERDFDTIKTIISEQNLIDLDDEFIDPDTKKAIQEARAFMAKRKTKQADLEQQIIAYHCKSGLPYHEIEQLTLYQFHKGLLRMDYMVSSNAILHARYSGMIEFKNDQDLPHWLGHIEEPKKNEDVIITKSTFDQQMKKLGLEPSSNKK